MSDSHTDVQQMVKSALDKFGYRPIGAAGDSWEHPTGTRVSMGFTGGQVRVRRYVPESWRSGRIPPVAWDVTHTPGEAEVRDFVLPHPSRGEQRKIAEFESAPVLPESWEAQFETVKEVGVVLEADTAQVPLRKYSGDAGVDLVVSEQVTINPGEFKDVPTGIRIGLPAGYWARITGRSSTLRKRGLLVSEGVIDNGYTGPIYCGCWNLTDTPVTVEAGERVAQVILHPVVNAEYEQIDEVVSADGRGDNGFGSSGQ